MVPGEFPEGYVDLSKFSIDRLSVMDDDELTRLIDGNHWTGRQLLDIAATMPDGPFKQAFQQRLAGLVPAPPPLEDPKQAVVADYVAGVKADSDRFKGMSSRELIDAMATPPNIGPSPRIPLPRGIGLG